MTMSNYLSEKILFFDIKVKMFENFEFSVFDPEKSNNNKRKMVNNCAYNDNL